MSQPSPAPVNLHQEEQAIRRAGTRSLLLCALCFGLGYVTLPLVFEFPTLLVNRLAFALQASVFVLLWVLVGVMMVSIGRRRSLEDVGGAASGPPSDNIALAVAFLQNTLEQAVLAVGAYLALATLLSGPWLSLIATAVVLFGVGRLLFLRGYRRDQRGAKGRAFGMTLTMLPTLAGYLLAIALMLLPS
ncbi:MAPEG family protein [Nodosilinea sp. PGN35]|uniref:MAPEG family protein n=1 Tax=Nodosilinea sp. PGN35 TaxID=3020489 RepID=UPI0023B273A1|nr:MAPEG family protein [Nodosilinea sp. TSF1-S3]MDF0367124.1 MAPEG family protein [Nodosilinea sp. TSF1-S3]